MSNNDMNEHTGTENKRPSQFYFACRNNDIELVRQLMNELPLEQLDRMEVNGSTALHAACFYCHIEIIKLLLERGFTRRVLNKYDNTPLDEATKEVRLLFKRSTNAERFVSNPAHEREKSNWIVLHDSEHSVVPPDRLPDTYDGKRLDYGVFHADQILEQIGNDMPKIDVIRRLFRRGVEEKDCIRLIQAFTAETDFYNRINNYLASDKGQKTGSIKANPLGEFTQTIYFNRQLHEKYQFKGTCYRTMKISSDHDLDIYQVGTKLMNRTFISTTKDRQFAEQCARDSNIPGRIAVMFSYQIRHDHTALDIENISEYQPEQEVLIMYDKVFKVLSVTTRSTFDVVIELRESKWTSADARGKGGGFLKNLLS